MCPQSEVYKKSALNYYCWHAPNSDVVDGRSVTLPQTAASYWGLPHACLLLCGTHNVLCVPFFLAIPWPQDSPTAADSVIRAKHLLTSAFTKTPIAHIPELLVFKIQRHGYLRLDILPNCQQLIFQDCSSSGYLSLCTQT